MKPLWKCSGGWHAIVDERYSLQCGRFLNGDCWWVCIDQQTPRQEKGRASTLRAAQDEAEAALHRMMEARQ